MIAQVGFAGDSVVAGTNGAPFLKGRVVNGEIAD